MMFLCDNEDGSKTLILDNGEKITVELPGGNGETFTIDADAKTITDEDDFDLTRARMYWCG